MKCDEARPLLGAYLDSELDARTTLEIDQHLKSCAECADLFKKGAAEEARLRQGLNRGQKTPAIWDQIERSVVTAASRTSREPACAGATHPVGWPGPLAALGEQVQAGWKHSRWVWSGLAASWVLILALNLSARGTEAPATASNRLPPAAEVRLALQQKRLLTADLAALAEPVPKAKQEPAPRSPRSERRSNTLNI